MLTTKFFRHTLCPSYSYNFNRCWNVSQFDLHVFFSNLLQNLTWKKNDNLISSASLEVQEIGSYFYFRDKNFTTDFIIW